MFVISLQQSTPTPTHPQHLIHELTSQAQIPSQFSSQNTPRVNRKLSRLDRVDLRILPRPSSPCFRDFLFTYCHTLSIRLHPPWPSNPCPVKKLMKAVVTFHEHQSHWQRSLPIQKAANEQNDVKQASSLPTVGTINFHLPKVVPFSLKQRVRVRIILKHKCSHKLASHVSLSKARNKSSEAVENTRTRT